jgi:acyl-CoA reductase-like NAD-dependent aldehyde dehydrogenase
MIFYSKNPATGEILHTHTEDTREAIASIVEKAHVAQLEWASLTPAKRFDYLNEFKKTIEAKVPDILKQVQQEAGKLKADGEGEVYDVIDAFDYYSAQYTNLTMPPLAISPDVFPGTEGWLESEPYGVLALIMPWNFSFYSPMMIIIAGLTAGNAIVLKHSEHTTLVGQMIRNLWIEAGLPADLLQVVVGGESAGRELVRAGCDKIFFVGSVEGGKDVISNAGVTPVQVELGGNSAAIVMPDADLDHAANAIAWGGTYHSGQDCAGIKRIFAHSSIVDDLQKRLVEIVGKLRHGIDYSPYISEEARATVIERLADAKAKGANILVGGEPINPGFWLTPSVVRVTNTSITLVKEETFGNVLPIMTFDNEQSLIESVNDTAYGLSNAIFTADSDNALKIGRKLQSGMIFVNDPFITGAGWDHWTGYKNSGFGTMDSKLNQCLRKRVYTLNKNQDKRAFWYPYST